MGLRLGIAGGLRRRQGGPSETLSSLLTSPQIGRLSKRGPARSVALGFHFCFGTFGGWPAFAPDDLSRPVELDQCRASPAPAGASIGSTSRPSIAPTTPSTRRSSGLDARGARVYLGAIHNMTTLKQRLDAARKVLPDFGLAAYCGFGAHRRPGEMTMILQDHLDGCRSPGCA